MYTIYEYCQKTEVSDYKDIKKWCVDHRKCWDNSGSMVVCDSVSIEDEDGLPVLIGRQDSLKNGKDMYLDKIETIERKINRLQIEKETAREEWIKAEHPLSIGDKVVVTGYTYRGKTIEVERLAVKPRFGGTWEWWATGPVLKKNGTPGKNYGEWVQEVAR